MYVNFFGRSLRVTKMTTGTYMSDNITSFHFIRLVMIVKLFEKTICDPIQSNLFIISFNRNRLRITPSIGITSIIRTVI
jgi:hypothetical protein